MRLLAIALLNLFAAAARTASANGTGVNLQGYIGANRQMKAYLDVGEASGTTPTLDVKLQESDDNSNWTDITGAVFAQKTTTGNEEISFKTNKDYVRAVSTIGGTTPSFTFGCYLAANRRLS